MNDGCDLFDAADSCSVCANCSYKFSISTVKDYPLLQQSLANGWNIGDGPSNYEMEQAWNDFISVFEALARRGY